MCKGNSTLFKTFPRGDNIKIMEIRLPTLKIFFRTTGPVSTKLGTKHPWMKGTQNFILQILNKRDNGFFLPLINVMIYTCIIALRKCVGWFELVSKVNIVAHGPLVLILFSLKIYSSFWRENFIVSSQIWNLKVCFNLRTRCSLHC